MDSFSDGMQVFFGDISILLLISCVLLVSLFGMGSLYNIAAIPSAVLAVTVLIYLIYLSIRKEIRDGKKL